MKASNIYRVDEFFDLSSWEKTKIDNLWVPARPIGLPGLLRRFRIAWLVFTGECDAVEWYKQ